MNVPRARALRCVAIPAGDVPPSVDPAGVEIQAVRKLDGRELPIPQDVEMALLIRIDLRTENPAVRRNLPRDCFDSGGEVDRGENARAQEVAMRDVVGGRVVADDVAPGVDPARGRRV